MLRIRVILRKRLSLNMENYNNTQSFLLKFQLEVFKLLSNLLEFIFTCGSFIFEIDRDLKFHKGFIFTTKISLAKMAKLMFCEYFNLYLKQTQGFL